MKANKLLKDAGYKKSDLLMNPPTGSIDTAENWALELANTDAEKDFYSLVLVDKDGNEIQLNAEIKEMTSKVIKEDMEDLSIFDGITELKSDGYHFRIEKKRKVYQMINDSFVYIGIIDSKAKTNNLLFARAMRLAQS